MSLISEISEGAYICLDHARLTERENLRANVLTHLEIPVKYAFKKCVWVACYNVYWYKN